MSEFSPIKTFGMMHKRLMAEVGAITVSGRSTFEGKYLHVVTFGVGVTVTL